MRGFLKSPMPGVEAGRAYRRTAHEALLAAPSAQRSGCREVPKKMPRLWGAGLSLGEAQMGTSGRFKRLSGDLGKGSNENPPAQYTAAPQIPDCGSFEVRIPDGRASVYFYWDDNPGRRSITASKSQKEAERAAKELARVEQDKLK